jgi:hypothetical protein
VGRRAAAEELGFPPAATRGREGERADGCLITCLAKDRPATYLVTWQHATYVAVLQQFRSDVIL